MKRRDEDARFRPRDSFDRLRANLARSRVPSSLVQDYYYVLAPLSLNLIIDEEVIIYN